MKILAIRGRNIASLAGDFEIDFTTEPLASAGIFAISGPTGAGKSTLLDTMCLALFARTPRTEQAKENNVKLQDVSNEQLSQSDPRFLLRRGTSSGYAEVDFLALNGFRYRTRWSVSRAREKENGRLQNPRLTLFNLDKETEEQGTRSELQVRIIELVGLTFEQFTRSVLLAQNDFSTFLKAEQGEKAALLEKLTGTALYSAISRRIFEKNTVAKEAFEVVQARMQGIALLSEEEELDLKQRLLVVENELKRVEALKVEQQSLQENIRVIEQQIVLRKAQQKEAEERLTIVMSRWTTARQDYEKGVEAQQQAETTYKSLQLELQQARKLDLQLDTALRDLSQAEQQWNVAKLQKEETEKKYQTALLLQQQGVEEINRLTVWRERYQQKAAIAEQLSFLLLHLDGATTARLGVEKATRSRDIIQKELLQIEKSLDNWQQEHELKRQQLKIAEKKYQQLEEELKLVDIQVLDQQMELLRVQREQLLIEQARLEATGTIKELREKLQAGNPCPVCGSTEHPYVKQIKVTPISSLTLELQKLMAQKDVYAQRTRLLAQQQQQLLHLHKLITDSEVARKDLLNKQQLASSRLEQEQTVIQEQTALLKQSLSAADTLFGNADWQQAWKQNPTSFRQTLTDFAHQWVTNGEKLRQLERDVSARKAACESLVSFLPSQIKLYEEATKLLEISKKSHAALRKERLKLIDGRSADEVDQQFVRQLESGKERLKQMLAVQTEQASYAEQTRGIVGQLTKDLEEAGRLLQERTLAFEKWNEDFLLQSEGEPLVSLLLRFTQEQSEISFRLRTQQENLQKLSGLQGELEAKRLDSERWAKLNELAGSADGAKFRRIAQGYTLDILLEYANVQLKNLTRRYRLERVPGTLALQVIDRDMCDEVRTVHTLSGGESFLVSLALALGLSSLSSNRMRVESLFIDEGFGSLDAETLRIAMDALECLRTQGRKIGVISHVQEMTERIPVRIQVCRAGNGRSFIQL